MSNHFYRTIIPSKTEEMRLKNFCDKIKPFNPANHFGSDKPEIMFITNVNLVVKGLSHQLLRDCKEMIIKTGMHLPSNTSLLNLTLLHMAEDY